MAQGDQGARRVPDRVPAHRVPDRVRVHPGRLGGTVRVPGDKSLSHRALILGAMVGREVGVEGLADSADVAATARALRSLGATVTLEPGEHGLHGTVAGPLVARDVTIDCGNSGTSLRLLAGVVAGLDGRTTLTGDESLRRRPVDRIVRPLEQMGARVEARDGGRLPPVTIEGGALKPVEYESPVASAQVKSAVLLAGLRTDGAEGDVRVTSPARSRDHTERMLRHLGVDVEVRILTDGRERVVLTPGALEARPLGALGDPSSAAFWMTAAALPAAAGGAGSVELTGVCLNPTRLGALGVLRSMGAHVEVRRDGTVGGEPVGTITVGPGGLAGAVVEGSAVVDAIDELPVLAVAGAVSRDGVEVRDAAELRVKESDRIATLAEAFAALGVEVRERPDGFRIPGGQRFTGGVIDSHGDHRIAMTAAVAATVATGPVEVRGFGCVGTSYPTFLEHLEQLGGSYEDLDGDVA